MNRETAYSKEDTNVSEKRVTPGEVAVNKALNDVMTDGEFTYLCDSLEFD